MRVVSLAAATVGDRMPAEAGRLAAGAGFAHVGVRLDRLRPDPARLDADRSHLDDLGIRVFDVEVVVLGAPAADETGAALVDAAARLGARFVLAVCDEPDRTRAAEQLHRLCERAADAGLRVGLEFMPFRPVATLGDAAALLDAVDHPGTALVVDALHLARSGASPAELAAPAARGVRDRVGYLQLADAPAAAPPGGPAALAAEAREARLLPGDGGLPLRELLHALPADTPLSVEVPNLASRADAPAAAAAALDATRRLLGLAPLA